MPTPWEINARSGWFRIPIRELSLHKDLIFRLVRKDFLASYQQTLLGPIWIFLQPLLITLTYIAVFKSMLGVSTDSSPSTLFYLLGIICWNYFSDSILNISFTYTAYASIFNKAYFSRIIVPCSYLLVNFLRFAIQFLLFLLIFSGFLILGFHVKPNIYLLWFPICLLLLSGFSLGAGLIFASLTAKYRDIQNLLSFLLRILMFISPIIYPLSIVPDRFKGLFLINPLTVLIEVTRYGFLGSGYHSLISLGYCAILMVLILVMGILLFNWRDGLVMDVI
ncbi:MAG TPA: ABC transporter permease [Chitinophagaceae bacterium]|nr:ABC transporter permease [Chitinophagaceae bacterium]